MDMVAVSCAGLEVLVPEGGSCMRLGRDGCDSMGAMTGWESSLGGILSLEENGGGRRLASRGRGREIVLVFVVSAMGSGWGNA